MSEIIYIKGDITKPISSKGIVIAHIVNDIGLMGSGVAKAIYEKWPDVRKLYLKWFEAEGLNEEQSFRLGNTQFVLVEGHESLEPGIIVANMIAQHSIMSLGEKKPIRYDALDECLKDVYQFCIDNKMSLHMPKIGSLRAGGDWNKIHDIISDNLKCDTYIYEYDGF